MINSIKDRLGGSEQVIALAVGMLILSLGAAMIWPMNAVYIHESLHMPVSATGLVLLLYNASAFAGNLVGGFVADRWSAGRSILWGALISLFVSVVMGWDKDIYYYSAMLILLGFFTGMIYPSITALAVKSMPREARKAVNFIYVSQNIGMAIGAAVGGWIASISTVYVFYANALATLLFIAIFYSFSSRDASPVIHPQEDNRDATEMPSSNTPGTGFLITTGILCISFMMTWICYSQWGSVIPVFMDSLHIPFAQYSLLWTLNGGLVLALQPLSSWYIKKYRSSLKRQMEIGTLLFAASMIIVSFSTSWWHFAAAMTILSLGEILVWPAVPAYMSDRAPMERKARILGIVAGIGTLGRMLGPLAGGLLYEKIGASIMFVCMAAICSISVLLYRYHDHWVRQEKQG